MILLLAVCARESLHTDVGRTNVLRIVAVQSRAGSWGSTMWYRFVTCFRVQLCQSVRDMYAAREIERRELLLVRTCASAFAKAFCL